jgi:hypothetical protein
VGRGGKTYPPELRERGPDGRRGAAGVSVGLAPQQVTLVHHRLRVPGLELPPVEGDRRLVSAAPARYLPGRRPPGCPAQPARPHRPGERQVPPVPHSGSGRPESRVPKTACKLAAKHRRRPRSRSRRRQAPLGPRPAPRQPCNPLYVPTAATTRPPGQGGGSCARTVTLSRLAFPCFSRGLHPWEACSASIRAGWATGFCGCLAGAEPAGEGQLR